MLPSAALPSALRPPRDPRARPSAPRDLKASEPSAGQVPRVRFPRSPQTTLAAPTLYPPAAPVPRRWLTPAFVSTPAALLRPRLSPTQGGPAPAPPCPPPEGVLPLKSVLPGVQET